MFDECESLSSQLDSALISIADVEHTAGSSGRLAPGGSALAPHLDYEGFESSPYEAQDAPIDSAESVVSVTRFVLPL
jgi:hypothetical protein